MKGDQNESDKAANALGDEKKKTKKVRQGVGRCNEGTSPSRRGGDQQGRGGRGGRKKG